MTDFTDKLRRRFRLATEPGTDPASAPAADVGAELTAPDLAARIGPSPAAELLRRRLLRRLPPRTKIELPPGEDLVNERGRCFVRRLRYPLGALHGRHALQTALAIDRARLAVLAKEPAAEALDLGRCLFLDTETTGLSGGAGTIVFLCGLAWFEGRELVLEQVFLRAFEEEPAALAHVAAHVSERPVLVTFVGKSFDRHRLASRMTLHRLPTDVLRTEHLDLYHAARRAYKGRLSDTRLRTVEESVLGVYRDEDMPGADAPAAWLGWLDDGTGRIDRVFEHNRLDVLSLVVLLGALAAGGDPDAGLR